MFSRECDVYLHAQVISVVSVKGALHFICTQLSLLHQRSHLLNLLSHLLLLSSMSVLQLQHCHNRNPSQLFCGTLNVQCPRQAMKCSVCSKHSLSAACRNAASLLMQHGCHWSSHAAYSTATAMPPSSVFTQQAKMHIKRWPPEGGRICDAAKPWRHSRGIQWAETSGQKAVREYQKAVREHRKAVREYRKAMMPQGARGTAGASSGER